MERMDRSPATRPSSLTHGLVGLALALALTLLASDASAMSFRVIQEWDDVNVATSGRTARTGATFDTSTLTGSGLERLEIEPDFFLGLFLNGIGQISASLTNNPPLALDQEGTVFVAYVDGDFRGVRNIVSSGNPAASLYNTSFPQPNDAGTVIMGDANMQYGFPISGVTNYVLVSTEFIAIPEPAAGLLLGAGLLGIASRRRPSFPRSRPAAEGHPC